MFYIFKAVRMIFAICIITAIFLAGGYAFAKTPGIELGIPTFALDIKGGLSSTYKSTVVESNDTGVSTSFALGGFAGEDKTFGFLLRSMGDAVDFELNKSSMKAVWLDSMLRFRWEWAYFGVVFSQVDLIYNKEGAPLLDAAGNGIGGNLGLIIPIGKIGQFLLDGTFVTITKTRDALGTDATVGTRTDFDLGVSFDLTRDMWDFLMGYRQQTLVVSTTDSFSEVAMTAYLGFRFALFF